MRKLLVPCDGSDSALRALAHAVAEAKADPMPAQVDLLHVADPDAVAADVDQQAVNDPLAADALRPQPPALAMQAMQAAAAVLDQAGIRHALHWRTGEPGAQIAAHACETACDEIIMEPAAGARLPACCWDR